MSPQDERSQSPSRLQRWEHRTEWPLAAVSVLFLIIYSVQVLGQPRAPTSHILQVLMSALYLQFVIDYVVRLSLARRRVRWLVGHLFDLVVVALPFLRPLRTLRLVLLFKILQHAIGDAVRGRVAVYTATAVVLLVYAASLAVLQAERCRPEANIVNFGDAVWWSIATITSVGYGDLYPVTGTGRLVAVLLMVGGISLVGVVTGTVASWIVQRVSEGGAPERTAAAAQINELRSEIRRLTQLITSGSTDRSKS